MGFAATVIVLGHSVTNAKTLLNVFVTAYTLIILVYITTSWLRLPYSPWLTRIQRFLFDVAEPYIRLFRRVLPPMGPLDLSPMVAVIALWLLDRLLITVLEQFH